MSYGQRKCANDELLSYFQVEAPIHRPSFFLFFSLTIKHKTKISLTIKILHLGQGSFTRKVRTIFTLKIIINIFVKLFLILVLHLRQFFIVRIFVKKATGAWGGSTFETSSLILKSYTRDPCNSPRWVLDSPFSVGTHQSFQILDLYNGGNHKNFQKCPLDSSK